MTYFACLNQSSTATFSSRLIHFLLIVLCATVLNTVVSSAAIATYIPVNPSAPETGSINGTRVVP